MPAPRQRPATLVMLLHGIAKGESTARLSRERDLDRSAEARYACLSKSISTTLSPPELMSGTAPQADELYQNAGKKVRRIATWPTRRAGAPRSAKAKAPRRTTDHQSSRLISFTLHEVRYWVLEHADKPTTRTIVEGNVPVDEDDPVYR